MTSSVEWGTAQVAEPVATQDSSHHTISAFRVVAGVPTILSLDPAEDFELNTDIIQAWQIVFESSAGDVLGEADYFRTLEILQPYILDQQNGSLLIRGLSVSEIEQILTNLNSTAQN